MLLHILKRKSQLHCGTAKKSPLRLCTSCVSYQRFKSPLQHSTEKRAKGSLTLPSPYLLAPLFIWSDIIIDCFLHYCSLGLLPLQNDNVFMDLFRARLKTLKLKCRPRRPTACYPNIVQKELHAYLISCHISICTN